MSGPGESGRPALASGEPLSRPTDSLTLAWLWHGPTSERASERQPASYSEIANKLGRNSAIRAGSACESRKEELESRAQKISRRPKDWPRTNDVTPAYSRAQFWPLCPARRARAKDIRRPASSRALSISLVAARGRSRHQAPCACRASKQVNNSHGTLLCVVGGAG